MSIRTEKIASVLQQEIAPILIQEFDAHRFGLITIKKITVSDDLKNAQVQVSIMKNKQNFLDKANKIAWKISKKMKPRLHLHTTPKLHFSLEGTRKSRQVLDLLDNL